MGTARSRMKKVAPVSVKEEKLCSSGGDRHGHLFCPSNTATESIRERDRTDCNSEGRESEFSAEDDTLAEVDRILAECENTDERLNNRTLRKMPMSGSKSWGLCHAKQHASNEMSRGGKHAELQHDVGVKNDEVNTGNKPTSSIQEQIIPPKNMLCCNNIENTATASSCGIGGIPSLVLPIMFDASDEDLMNTIEREFG